MRHLRRLAAVFTGLALAGCSGAAATSASAPTQAPSPVATATEPAPTPADTPTPLPQPTLPPADATITLEQKHCSYDGPEPIPAVESLTVNVYFNTKYYLNGIVAGIVDEGKTRQDVIDEMNSELAPASWLTPAGTIEGFAGGSTHGTFRNARGGPLRGPIYISCIGGASYQDARIIAVLGPFEVK